MSSPRPPTGKVSQSPFEGPALKFVLLLGVVSLLSDITYEGARSITGPFLAILGAGAAVVGIVAGLGEFIGYGLRLFSGYLTDRTRRYWTITLVGYGVNLFAVPLLALAGSWEIAVLLIVAERAGKAVRTPARDVMLSYATSKMGRGWGFGVHEALDQVGAVLGPLIVATVLFLRNDYRMSFGILIVPASLAIIALLAARWFHPKPREFESESTRPSDGRSKGFRRAFWIYLAAVACIGIGYADFPLLAYHFKANFLVPDVEIPVFYATAMAVDAIAALGMGRLFDRFGVRVMIPVSLATSFVAPFAFSFDYSFALTGVVLWGVGMGAQESIMRSAVANMVPAERRGSGYGIFNTVYGFFWFLGSAMMGLLYGVSITYLVLFSVIFELASIPWLLLVRDRSVGTGN